MRAALPSMCLEVTYWHQVPRNALLRIVTSAVDNLWSLALRRHVQCSPTSKLGPCFVPARPPPATSRCATIVRPAILISHSTLNNHLRPELFIRDSHRQHCLDPSARRTMSTFQPIALQHSNLHEEICHTRQARHLLTGPWPTSRSRALAPQVQRAQLLSLSRTVPATPGLVQSVCWPTHPSC